MAHLIPYRVRRDAATSGVTLQLRNMNQRLCLTLCVPMEHARLILAEMHGLNTDYCGHHHLASGLLEALDAKIVGVAPRETEQGWVSVMVRLQTPWGVQDVKADVVAALSVALHLGVPFLAGEEYLLTGNESAVIQVLNDAQSGVPIPPVFRELLNGLDLPLDGERGPNEGQCSRLERDEA